MSGPLQQGRFRPTGILSACTGWGPRPRRMPRRWPDRCQHTVVRSSWSRPFPNLCFELSVAGQSYRRSPWTSRDLTSLKHLSNFCQHVLCRTTKRCDPLPMGCRYKKSPRLPRRFVPRYRAVSLTYEQSSDIRQIVSVRFREVFGQRM